MSREEIFEHINIVFKDVFDNDDICIEEETTAADVKGWDSLMHITLMDAIEEEFDIKFDMKTIIKLKNVGEIADIIEEEI